MKYTTLITTTIAILAAPLTTAVSNETAPPEDSVQAAEDAARKELRSHYDKNGDGALDKQERRVLERDLKRGRVPVPSTIKNRKEAKAFRSMIVSHYDADHSGKLDQWELLNLQWDIVEGRKNGRRLDAVVMADTNK